MGDAAQGEPIQHEVFEKPFPIKPKFEMVDTPGNYRRFPGGDKLPDQTKIWYVQKTGKSYGGVVSRLYGFADSPDAEILTPGFNTGKESGAVGVGRHGNVLQWGFSAPPSRMTSAGKRFFINCIHYIRKFDGKAPLVRVRSSDRIDPIRLAAIITKVKDREEFFKRIYNAKLYNRYKDDPEGLAEYYQKDYELIYIDSGFRLDRELQSLGLESNRRIETLETLIDLLQDNEKTETARLLLKRYTNETFDSHEQWKQWFDENRERIFFTDVGGYKFLVTPKGYLSN